MSPTGRRIIIGAVLATAAVMAAAWAVIAHGQARAEHHLDRMRDEP